MIYVIAVTQLTARRHIAVVAGKNGRADRTRLGAAWRKSLLPAELLVLQPVWDDAVEAEAALLVLFVVGEIALEPLDVAVALEGQHVGGDAVEEEAVVADDDGAAGEVEQSLLQRAQRVDIEVVGRLVEQKKVRAAFQHLGEMHPVALAA